MPCVLSYFNFNNILYVLVLTAYAFNGDISVWNVSSVRDMSSMYYRASGFNADLSTWDVSRVTDMDYMFQQALASQPHRRLEWCSRMFYTV